MPRPRALWWILGLAASIFGYLLLNLYAEVFGPGAIGVSLHFTNHGARVVGVVPGFAAARTGIEPGDVIVTAAGLPVRTLFDWRMVMENTEVGRPLALTVEHDSRTRDTALTLEASWRQWTLGNWVTFAAKVITRVVTFSLALLVGLTRPRDPVALLGALLLASLVVTNFAPVTFYDPHAPSLPNGAAALWRSLPPWLGALLWGGAAVFATGPLLLLAFFTEFPRTVFPSTRARLAFWLAWMPVVVIAFPALMLVFYLDVYSPARYPGALPAWFTPFVGVAVVLAVAVALSLFTLNYRWLDDPNARRRVRVLVLGALVGVSAAVPVAMASFLSLPAGLHTALRSPFVLTTASVLFLAFPLSFAYAILRHQLLDVRLIVRQGLQYALARRVVLSLVPACAIVLAIDLLVHGDQPLTSILRSRGWIYAAVAALAYAAHGRQQRWLQALDRRFFRERYDAQRLMREVVEQVRSASSLERAATHVVSRIESALHPEFVALVSRAPREPAFGVLASAPGSGSHFSLPADSKVAALARVLGKPLDVGPGESGWVNTQLPREEAEFIRRAGIELLVPIATPPGRAEALVVLGRKRSEEPYSGEDQELLATVAASLALLVEPPMTTSVTGAFGECPRCGACHDAGATTCAMDGAALSVINLPRLLAQRYRLERRLGQGGMGTVYEAADTQLDRRVAVKVIREELVGSAMAAERFHREARATASFAHPNVVTVHDFGIAGETRAFLVMELLRGQTLRDAMRHDGQLAPRRVLAVLRELCAAAEAAHARQLVHRDLKPENVFLAREEADERVKVLDFGIAKVLAADAPTSGATATGLLVGTLHYMGPEQLRGGAVAANWDLWALAVMTYEMLTGALPFVAPTPVDYQSAVLSGRFTPVAAHLPDGPPALQAFFVRALAVDPSQRPGRAPSLYAELAQALA